VTRGKGRKGETISLRVRTLTQDKEGRGKKHSRKGINRTNVIVFPVPKKRIREIYHTPRRGKSENTGEQGGSGKTNTDISGTGGEKVRFLSEGRVLRLSWKLN